MKSILVGYLLFMLMIFIGVGNVNAYTVPIVSPNPYQLRCEYRGGPHGFIVSPASTWNLPEYSFEGLTDKVYTPYGDTMGNLSIFDALGKLATLYNFTYDDCGYKFAGIDNYVVESNDYMEIKDIKDPSYVRPSRDVMDAKTGFRMDSMFISTNYYKDVRSFDLTLDIRGNGFYTVSPDSDVPLFDTYGRSSEKYPVPARLISTTHLVATNVHQGVWSVDTSNLENINSIHIMAEEPNTQIAIDELNGGVLAAMTPPPPDPTPTPTISPSALTISPSTVPEPGTIILFGLGLFIIGFGMRRTKFVKNSMITS